MSYGSCKSECSDNNEMSDEWKNAFQLVQSGYVGSEKTTNHRIITLKPFEIVTVSGLARKDQTADAAVTEPTESSSSRIGLCPRVVSLQKAGSSQRVPFRIFNISAKTINIPTSDHLVRITRCESRDK